MVYHGTELKHMQRVVVNKECARTSLSTFTFFVCFLLSLLCPYLKVAKSIRTGRMVTETYLFFHTGINHAVATFHALRPALDPLVSALRHN